MGRIIIALLLTCTGQAFARVQIQPQLQKHIQNFNANKVAMKSCATGNPSSEPTIGCVQAYRYMTDLCKKRDIIRIDRRYEKDSRPYLTEACAFYDSMADHVSELFDTDRQSCAPGFETPADGFMTVSQNADILDEASVYNLGRRSCATYQTYVNLCTYVDGNLKELMPKTYEKLPVVDFRSNPRASNCKPRSNGENSTIYSIDQDLAKLAKGGTTKNVYETIIADYRARKPAGQLTLPACDDIRTSYKNLRCNLFEDENNKPKKPKDADDESNQTVSDAGQGRLSNN
jgi:hypothetical protein